MLARAVQLGPWGGQQPGTAYPLGGHKGSPQPERALSTLTMRRSIPVPRSLLPHCRPGYHRAEKPTGRRVCQNACAPVELGVTNPLPPAAEAAATVRA